MKFQRLFPKVIIATALLGTTLGGTFFNINALADDQPQSAYKTNEGSSTPYSTKRGTATVNNGSLTLDSVPDFSFNSKNKENDNNLSLTNDGKLKVTDYRTKDGSQNLSQNQNTNQSNWSLSVSSSGFTNGDNNQDNNDWEINFNKNQLDDLGNDKYGHHISSGTQISEPTLYANQSNNNKDIVTNGQYGITQMSYGPSNGNGANLKVPNVQPDANNPYTTNLTWSLNSTVNDTDD